MWRIRTQAGRDVGMYGLVYTICVNWFLNILQPGNSKCILRREAAIGKFTDWVVFVPLLVEAVWVSIIGLIDVTEAHHGAIYQSWTRISQSNTDGF